MWWWGSWLYEYSKIEDLLRAKTGTSIYKKLIRKTLAIIKLKASQLDSIQASIIRKNWRCKIRTIKGWWIREKTVYTWDWLYKKLEFVC